MDVMRVAVASSDGKVVNNHFGRAERFLIVEISPDGASKFCGMREVLPLCSGGEHMEEELDQTMQVLSDCSVVLVSRIGSPMRHALEEKNIAVYELPEAIGDALAKIRPQGKPAD